MVEVMTREAFPFLRGWYGPYRRRCRRGIFFQRQGRLGVGGAGGFAFFIVSAASFSSVSFTDL